MIVLTVSTLKKINEGFLAVDYKIIQQRGRRGAKIGSSPVWNISCIINEPYANMRERAISSDQS